MNLTLYFREVEEMKRIIEERERLGFNQSEFANKLKVANNTLCTWEKGGKNPPLSKLKEMADIFNCSTDYLLERTDIKNAAVIEEYVNGDHVKIELNDKYYQTLTPAQVKEILSKLQEVGFDIKKLI